MRSATQHAADTKPPLRTWSYAGSSSSSSSSNSTIRHPLKRLSSAKTRPSSLLSRLRCIVPKAVMVATTI